MSSLTLQNLRNGSLNVGDTGHLSAASSSPASTNTPLYTLIQTVSPGADGNASNVTAGGGMPGIDQFYFYQTEQLVFLSLFLVFIVVGNSIVLLAVGLSRRRHSRMHFFILHLALADLAVGLITVLTDLIWKITIHWHAGNVMCKVVKFAQAFVMFASNFMLVALSIDRYDAIARPLNFSTTWTRCKVLVGLAWSLSALFSTPLLFISNLHVQNGFPNCWISFPEQIHWQIYVSLVAVVLFVLPALIITGCYTMIIYIIWKNSHLLSPVKPKHTFTTDKKHLLSANGVPLKGSPKPNRYINREMGRSSRGIIPQAKIRTVKMTFTIVIVFILCWSPYFVYDLLQVFGHIPMTQEMVAVSTFIQSLAPLNSAANPIIYGVFSTRVCRYLRRLKFFRAVSSIFCCQEPSPIRATGMSEFSNMTETDMTRRSPRTTANAAANNVEMCDLILSSVKQ